MGRAPAHQLCFYIAGDISHIFMKNIILKLADLMNDVGRDKPDTNHVSAQGCSCNCPNVDGAVVSSDLLNFYCIFFCLYYFFSQ